MLLFKKAFHSGITDGTVTLTFRQWSKPLVKPGGRYRCHPIGVVEVDAVDRIKLRDISESDAHRSGFSDRKALIAYMQEVSSDPLTPSTQVFRIAFRYGGDGDRVQLALEEALTDADVERIAEKLQGYDARSPQGPWTAKTLRLIAKHPRVAASRLAPKLGRETLPFKANVVKLKKLGLTQSFEVGYEVSPRGRRFMSLRKRW